MLVVILFPDFFVFLKSFFEGGGGVSVRTCSWLDIPLVRETDRDSAVVESEYQCTNGVKSLAVLFATSRFVSYCSSLLLVSLGETVCLYLDIYMNYSWSSSFFFFW